MDLRNSEVWFWLNLCDISGSLDNPCKLLFSFPVLRWRWRFDWAVGRWYVCILRVFRWTEYVGKCRHAELNLQLRDWKLFTLHSCRKWQCKEGKRRNNINSHEETNNPVPIRVCRQTEFVSRDCAMLGWCKNRDDVQCVV